jgi:hypothetical protein
MKKHSWVSPSEVGQFAYCAKAWEMKRKGLQTNSGGSAHLARGTQQHRFHEFKRRLAGVIFGFGAMLVVAAAVLYLFSKV